MATLSRDDSTRALQDATEAEASANRLSNSSGSDGLRSRISDSSVTDVVPRASIQRSRPPVKNSSWIYASIASVVCLFIGYYVGVMTDVAVYVDKGMRLTDGQDAKVEVILHVSSIFGAAAAGRIADKVGRVRVIRWTWILFSGGSLLVGLFPSNALLLLGRAFIQLGAAFGPMIATSYITEISPVFSRGLLASLPDVLMNAGELLGYVFNSTFFELHPDYGRFAIIGLGVVTFFLVTSVFQFMPESPYWLLMQGKVLEARLVLSRTSVSQEDVDGRLIDIMTALRIPVEPHRDFVQVTKPSTGEGVWRELLGRKTKPVCHAVTCAVGVQVLQQLSGFDTIMLFTPTIIKEAGVSAYPEKLDFAIKFQIAKTIASLFIPFLLEWVGRQLLLLISISGMTASLAALGASLRRIYRGDMKAQRAVIPSLCCYGAFHSFGMGPVAAIYTSEVLPPRLRAQGYAFAEFLNQLTGAFLAGTFTPLCEAVTLGGALLIFMVMSLLGTMFVCFVLPETQGQTLEETQTSFGTLFKLKRSSAATGEVEMHGH